MAKKAATPKKKATGSKKTAPKKSKSAKAVKKAPAKALKKTVKKAPKRAPVKAVKKAPAKPAKKAQAKPAKKAAAVKAAAPVTPAGFERIIDRVEKEIRLCRGNESDLGKRIDEVGDAGERILDEIDAIRREVDTLRGGSLAAKVNRLEEAAKIMQKDMTGASSERKGIIKELKKTVDELEDYRDHDERCNAGPAMERIMDFEHKLDAMQSAVEGAKKAMEHVTADLVAKVNELAAKFNMHSHFLKARNFDQDLFFHVDAASTEGGEAGALPESPRTLGVKPTKAAQEPSSKDLDLRLTPPRHWEDPLIWFGNVNGIDKEE